MYRIVLTLLSFVTLFSAFAVPHPTQSIKVSGVIHNVTAETPRTLIINECDISDKSKRCFAEIDSTGRFEASIPFYYGHTFTINYNRSMFINAYAEPGDSIFVDIDASKSPVEFHLTGDRSQLNEEYSHAFYDLYLIYYDLTLPADTDSLSVYMPKFKSEVARTQAVVNEYVKEKSLQPETAELLYLDNIFNIANQAIGFRGNGIEEQIAFFTDSLFDILNERNVKVMIFPYHLAALIHNDPDYVDKVPKSLIRDLMYAIGEKKPSRNDFFNPSYYDRLYSDSIRTVDLSALKTSRILVMENDTISDIDNVNPIEWLKERFPSRPIYMDVSATWCGPCRASLSGSEDVRSYFKDSDIVFAVIWLKSDMESWSKLAPNIHNAIHIFIPDEDMSNRIMGSLNLPGFPSYYFIDSDGNMSTEDIPHFNDPQLVDYLKERQ